MTLSQNLGIQLNSLGYNENETITTKRLPAQT